MGCNGSKQAGAAAAPEKTQQLEGDFKITLERTADEQTLGLSIQEEGAVLSVLALKEEGLVPDFIKATANVPEQHVKEGDRIIAVNGVNGDAEKMKAELNTKTIVLTVQRPPAQKPEADGAKKEEAAPAAATTEEPAAEPATAEEKKEDAAAPAPAAEAASAAPEEVAQNPETVAEKAEEKAPAAEESQPKADAAPAADEAAPAEAAAADAEAVPPAEAAPAEADAAVAEASPAPEAEQPSEAAAPEAKSAAPLLSEELAPVEVGELGDVAIAEDAREERLCKLSIC